MAKVVHLTSAHSAFDGRVFFKECCDLARAGHDVTLIAPHTKNERSRGVHVHGIPPTRSRLARMSTSVYATYREAVKADADVYHFHDPELIPVGLLLKLRGRRVIYDVHEDAPRQKLANQWIPRGLRRLVGWSVVALEKCCGWSLDGIVTATPAIAERFPPAKTIIVRNYPRLSEFQATPPPLSTRPADILYSGLLAPGRGIFQLLDAVALLPGHLNTRMLVAGRFSSSKLKDTLEKLPVWKRIKFLGWLDRQQIADIHYQVRVGVVTLLPTAAYVVSLPTKMFEYMAAGLPVVASNFPFWRDIVEGGRCGLVVDPADPQAIATAIQWLLEHPDEAEAMGRRGRELVEKHFNWEHESSRLVTYYARLLAGETLCKQDNKTMEKGESVSGRDDRAAA